jgi:hypothetical protein
VIMQGTYKPMAIRVITRYAEIVASLSLAAGRMCGVSLMRR